MIMQGNCNVPESGQLVGVGVTVTITVVVMVTILRDAVSIHKTKQKNYRCQQIALNRYYS